MNKLHGIGMNLSYVAFFVTSLNPFEAAPSIEIPIYLLPSHDFSRSEVRGRELDSKDNCR